MKKAPIPWGLLSFILLLIAFGFYFVFGDYGALRWYREAREKRRLEQQVIVLEKKIAELDSIKKRLETDLQYIEKIARENYNMKKPGEQVYQTIREED